MNEEKDLTVDQEPIEEVETPEDLNLTEEEENLQGSNQEDENQRLLDKDRELAEVKAALVRLQADFVNYRTRVEKEKQSTIAFATENLMVELLGVLDNIDRAINNCEDESSIMDGVCMIRNQMIEILQKEGLEEIVSDGEPFDPNEHFAVVTEEIEGMSPDMVLETLQKGYRIKDKVIRPSMVKVSK